MMPGTGGPTAGIPNHVEAGFEEMGDIFLFNSVNKVISNRLTYATVDWLRAARSAYQVMVVGGELSLNVWTRSEDEIATVLSAFRHAGFRNVRSLGEGAGTLILGAK